MHQLSCNCYCILYKFSNTQRMILLWVQALSLSDSMCLTSDLFLISCRCLIGSSTTNLRKLVFTRISESIDYLIMVFLLYLSTILVFKDMFVKCGSITLICKNVVLIFYFSSAIPLTSPLFCILG